jgi:outer membrane protein OmpA-like peptidoglycan-associated protein
MKLKRQKGLFWIICLGLITSCSIVPDRFKDTVVKAFGTQEDSSDKPKLMLILDSSGSMRQTDGYGNLKIDIAKNVVSDVLDKIPENTTNVSLMVYDGCQTKMLVPPSNTDLELVKSRAMTINPYGDTPIAKSIQEAGRILGNNPQKTTLILVSDGQETCGGDPCAEARRLKQRYNVSVKIYTVGYFVDNNAREQLVCVASAGGGKYFDAKDSFALDAVVHEIVREEVTKAFDEDGDGVINNKDLCPGTLAGFSVDENGCETVYTFNIHFDVDSAVIKPEFLQTVEQLADYLKTNSYKAQLQGHTDSTASNAYNKKLSQRRARAVMKKLMEYGVSPNRLSSVGFGEDRPIADNSSSPGRYKNRRVEAHIIK